MYQTLKKTNPYYSEVNKKVNRKLKCENGDNIIDKFVGLKVKTMLSVMHHIITSI